MFVYLLAFCTDTAARTHIPDNLLSTTAPDVAMLPRPRLCILIDDQQGVLHVKLVIYEFNYYNIYIYIYIHVLVYKRQLKNRHLCTECESHGIPGFLIQHLLAGAVQL